MLEALEKKLSYEDIRFYRSIARSELRKDAALRKQLEEDKQKQQSQQSSTWSSWIWGSSASSSSDQGPDSGSGGESAFIGPMTDQQRKELYDVLDYDEKAALADSFEAPRGALKMRATAKLQRGSFALMTDPHGKAEEIISVVFDAFQANFIQRTDSFELTTALGGLRVFDGTTKDTLYPQIVHVKSDESGESGSADKEPDEDPFFSVKFENNPLDERADSALTVRMRHMEIIYHKGYVEAIYRFFKPPASQLESVEALLVSPIFLVLYYAIYSWVDVTDVASAECGESNAGRPSQRDASGSRVCASESQDGRYPDGHECSRHHHPRKVYTSILHLLSRARTNFPAASPPTDASTY